MNPELQTKALAELDGWKRGLIKGTWERLTNNPRTPDEVEKINRTPNYLHSYDAIIPLIRKWLKQQPENVEMLEITLASMLPMMFTIHSHKGVDIKLLLLSPTQLSEALLRATGKWIE